jgi:hypothetical protein
MPGGRKTHDYPFGIPFRLVLVNIAALGVGVLWVIVAFGSWSRTVGIIALFVALVFINSKLHQAYERTGQAVPIPRDPAVVKFVNGMPGPLFALRAAFFVGAASLVVFGVAPLAAATTKIGMIGSVISLVLIGILNVALEQYYVHIGRGKEVPVGLSGSAATSKSADNR